MNINKNYMFLFEFSSTLSSFSSRCKILDSSVFSSSRTIVSSYSRISGSKVSSSLISIWYGEALRKACPSHWPQTKEHCNPAFLHPNREPQPFSQLQNIMLSNSFGAGGFIVITDSRNLSLIFKLQFYGVLNYAWRAGLHSTLRQIYEALIAQLHPAIRNNHRG